MQYVLDEAREKFDWVILDTPPVGLLPDAHLLAAMVDGAVLIVGAGMSPHRAVAKAAEVIGRERILGVVLNRVAATTTCRTAVTTTPITATRHRALQSADVHPERQPDRRAPWRWSCFETALIALAVGSRRVAAARRRRAHPVPGRVRLAEDAACRRSICQLCLYYSRPVRPSRPSPIGASCSSG